MALDERSISVMNFHYVRHTMDRFLADVCNAGVSRIELWAAAPHFYIGDKTLADARALRCPAGRRDRLPAVPARALRAGLRRVGRADWRTRWPDG